MAEKEGKKVILADVVEETQKNDPYDSPKEAAEEIFGNFGEVLERAFKKGKENYEKDFFIEILIKIEKFVKDTIRPYFNITYTCPNPKYRQTVYHYEKKTDKLNLLWVLPDQYHASFFQLSPQDFTHCPENVKYLHEFNDGTLQKIADDFNSRFKR